MVEITKEVQFVENLVMKPTLSANFIYSSIKNDPFFAFKSTIISIKIITNHKLQTRSQILITVPDQVTLTSDLSCWVSSAPDSKRDCSFDEEARQIKISSINLNIIMGGAQITIEIGGFSNSKFAAKTDSFIV